MRGSPQDLVESCRLDCILRIYGYRGDLGVKLYNFHETDDLQVKAGDRIAQIVVYPLIQPEFEFTEDVTESARGDKGFGSSDTPVDPESISKPGPGMLEGGCHHGFVWDNNFK